MTNLERMSRAGTEDGLGSLGLMKRNKLMECKKNRTIVAIYIDGDETDHFASGFVEAVTDEHVLLAHIAPYGEYDGFRTFEVERIYQIVTEGQYIKRLQELYEIKGQSHPSVGAETDSVIISLLRYAKQNRLVIAAELWDSGYDDVQGLVSKIEDDTIIVERLDDYGRADGVGVLETQRITRLVCDSDKEIALRLLHEHL